jgi:cytochrome c5
VIDIEREIMKKYFSPALILILLAILIVSCSASGTTAAPASNSTSSEATVSESSSSSNPATVNGKSLLEARCATCHGLDTVENRKGTADEWKMVVENHIQRGLELSSEEESVLVQYLAENYK